MIPRPQAGTQRPPPSQRVPSAGSHRPLNRPALPSKLSNVRSASQQENAAALKLARAQGAQSATSQPGIKQEAAPVKSEAIDSDVEQATPGGNDAPKPYLPNNGLPDGQSPRNWDQNTNTPATPPLPPPPKNHPLPLPSRPSFLSDATSNQSRPAPAASRGLRDPARRSTGLCAPAVAVHLPRGKVADFFPWTGVAGAHSEDVMSEVSVRSGNNDKPGGPALPPIAAESNTARPNIWPQMKGKQGMQMLSALFCQVLDKRQQMGRCTAPSTFKPPPRVTLTDTKREAWLKDLANPEVPLRKLSRTIPHGIRGKVLLDHCITKNIPIARAVWLSQCVGANEIRAFKRKGVSGPSALAGELKWIRDWTVCVEDFVQGVIGECGHPGWSQRINYAIRLATYFFSEHLLDGEHYVDWVLTSLKNATKERLPVWVLLTQVYWKHLTSQRKRGQRLSEAFMAHAKSLMLSGHASDAPLVARIQQLISILAIAHQGCLVLPSTWKEYKDTLENIASLDRFVNAKSALQSVQKRNARIAGCVDPTAVLQTHAKQQIINTLDRVGLGLEIPSNLLPPDDSILSDTAPLTVVLDWATSRHRHGTARVYLAARIVRHWNLTGADTDGMILQMLEDATSDPSIDIKPLNQIAALLARSGHFSVGRYLQWLISIGTLSGIPTASNDARLLLELPTESLQPHVLNLRRTILSRMGYSAQSEMYELERSKSLLSSLLQMATFDAPLKQTSDVSHLPTALTGAIKFAIAQWLCDGLAATKTSGAVSTLNDNAFKGGLRVFMIVRETLEQFEDFVSLSACIIAASGSTTDAQLLATLADTINMHADVFAAIGVLHELVSRLLSHQQNLRRRSFPLDKTFLQALSSLVHRVPCEEISRQSVATDLHDCETQSSVAACSPASDSMVMTAEGVPESNEDISRILASGNTMDEHLFTRMFGIIADRAMKAGLQGVALTGGWFSQLRRFDSSAFDQLLLALVNRMKEPSFTIQTFVEVTAALVGSGCMKIDVPLRLLARHGSLTKEPNALNRIAEISLELVLPFKSHQSLPDTSELYKFQLEQKLFREEHVDEVFSFLSVVLSVPTDVSMEVDYSFDERVISFLRHSINKSRMFSTESLLGKTGASGGVRMQRLLDRLTNPTGAGNNAAKTPITRIQRILASANELSLQSCKLALKQCFLSTCISEEDKNSLSKVFQDAIEQDSPVWPELLTALDEQMVYKIHAWACDRAVSLMSDFVSSIESTVKTNEIQRYLNAADISSLSVGAQGGQPQAISLLNDHLASLGRLMENMDPLDATQSSHRQRLGFGLDVLLRVTVKHFQSSIDNIMSSSEVIALTGTLCLMLLHQKLQNQRATLEYILDVTSMIVDDLSSETMTLIVRNLPSFVRNDPRIRYLFGITFSPDSWLALASKVYAQPAQVAAAQQAQMQASTPSSLPRPSHPLPPRPGSSMLQRTPSMNCSQNNTTGGSPQPGQAVRPPLPPQSQRGNYEIKYNPFQIRRWEIMTDPTPNMGANDTSLSLGLFQARKVS